MYVGVSGSTDNTVINVYGPKGYLRAHHGIKRSFFSIMRA